LPGVLFHGASIKPGKPVIGGLCNSKPVFGLPGHPVAVYICFELFVKPVLNQMLGLTDKIFKNNYKGKDSTQYSLSGWTRGFHKSSS